MGFYWSWPGSVITKAWGFFRGKKLQPAMTSVSAGAAALWPWACMRQIIYQRGATVPAQLVSYLVTPSHSFLLYLISLSLFDTHAWPPHSKILSAFPDRRDDCDAQHMRSQIRIEKLQNNKTSDSRIKNHSSLWFCIAISNENSTFYIIRVEMVESGIKFIITYYHS